MASVVILGNREYQEIVEKIALSEAVVLTCEEAVSCSGLTPAEVIARARNVVLEEADIFMELAGDTDCFFYSEILGEQTY